jgi:hypothetical protein
MSLSTDRPYRIPPLVVALPGFLLGLAFFFFAQGGGLIRWRTLRPPPEPPSRISGGNAWVLTIDTVSGRSLSLATDRIGAKWEEALPPVARASPTVLQQPPDWARAPKPLPDVVQIAHFEDSYGDYRGIYTAYALLADGSLLMWQDRPLPLLYCLSPFASAALFAAAALLVRPSPSRPIAGEANNSRDDPRPA